MMRLVFNSSGILVEFDEQALRSRLFKENAGLNGDDIEQRSQASPRERLPVLKSNGAISLRVQERRLRNLQSKP